MTPEELELQYLRRILIGMVQYTVDDLNNEREFKTRQNQNAQRHNYESALTFIRSRAFDVVCDAIDLPACRVRRRCLA
jgi:hypothetical protein